MVYRVHRLTQASVDRTVKEVSRAREAGQVVKSKLIPDGNGLYLQLPELSFISRLRFAERRIEPGHGSARSVSLKDARAANEAARRRRGDEPCSRASTGARTGFHIADFLRGREGLHAGD
jgi:hypothetical protein